MFAKKRRSGFISPRPEEFLVIQREHIQAFLFAGNQYILDVPAKGQHRADFQIIVAPVRHEILDGLPRQGLKLHVVEYDEGFPLVETDAAKQLKLQEEEVQIVHVAEEIDDFRRRIREINDEETLIFPFRKFPRHGRLSDATRPLYQKRRAPLRLHLPFDHLPINLSLEHGASPFDNFIFA